MAEGGSKLSEEEICECLRSFSVPVKLSDIKTPTKEFIIRVFESFLRDFQIDITSPVLRTWESTNHIEDPDLYEDVQLLLLLVASVNSLTSPCGLNITIKDILEPKPKRTKKILNYLLVFWNYYLQKYARYHAMVESYEGEKKKAELLIAENASLDERYNEMLQVFKSLQPKGELSSIVKMKEEKAVKCKTESETLGADYQALKAKEVNIRNEIGAIDVKIITAKETLEQLSQCILSSPDRINAEIKRIDDRIKAEDMKIKEGENRYKDAVKKLELQEKLLTEEETLLNTLKEVNDVMKDLRDTVKSIVDINKQISEEEEKVRRLLLDIERKEDGKLQQKQKSTKLVMNAKTQVETLKGVLKAFQNDEEKLKKGIEFLKISNKNILEDIHVLDEKIIAVIDKTREADAESKEREIQFKNKLKEVRDRFKSECKQTVDAVRDAFSNM